jgi:hypothetical protein
MPLCGVCERFNIRALICAVAKRLETPDPLGDRNEFPEHLPFYCHDDNLHKLELIDEKCRKTGDHFGDRMNT